MTGSCFRSFWPAVYVDIWYAGPQLPNEFAPEIHPNVRRVRLSWEHGHVQAVMLLLNGVYSESVVRTMFAVETMPTNVMATSIQRCMKDASCLVISGFDHLGAGEAQCGDDSQAAKRSGRRRFSKQFPGRSAGASRLRDFSARQSL